MKLTSKCEVNGNIFIEQLMKMAKPLIFIYRIGVIQKAAKRFIKKLIKRHKDSYPTVINTDKNPAYLQAIRHLKKDKALPERTKHQRIKYNNNQLESDHGKLKRLIKLVSGFQSMKTALATLKGFEVMRMFKKGQFKGWMYGRRNEISFINELFEIYS